MPGTETEASQDWGLDSAWVGAVSNTAGHALSQLKAAGQLVACEVRTLVS